jgi:CDP-glucose 4,6-dehydratase
MEDMVKNAFSGIYKGKKVLVTGHTGFKGSWLSFWLNMLGADVAGYSLYVPSEPSNFKALCLDDRLLDISGDIRNIDTLLEVFREFKPDMVFHLAAQPIVRVSYDDPKTTFDTNLGGTVNVLECIRNTDSVKAAVIITSDKCYENVASYYGYRETDRLGGKDPYSASKACAEIATSSYIRSFFTDDRPKQVATARAGNVIGGGDWAEDRIIPDCVKAWSKDRKAVLRNPKSTRPWQHVLEPVSGYLLLGAKLFNRSHDLNGESFNFGPTAEASYTVESLVDKLASAWGGAKWEALSEDSPKDESILLKLCCDKALSMLGWKQVLDINETVSKTAEWYRDYYCKKVNIADVTEGQIEFYCKKANQEGIAWAK